MRHPFPCLSVFLILATSCASAAATFRSGVGETTFDHAPYYAGAPATAIDRDTSRIAWLPITYQGGRLSSIFDLKSGPGTPIAELLADMNRHLDSALATRAVRLDGAAAPAKSAPDVRFGCTPESPVDDDCAGDAGTRLRLAVARPSGEWTSWMQGATAASGVSRTLVITVEVGQYFARQRGLKGDKSIELGTLHEQKLPWLTGVETPMMVLQLTGVLVDSTGSAIRIGAEGMAVKRTGIIAGSFGAQELFDERDIEQFRMQRRDDLAGAPLTWRVALDHLLEQLSPK